MNCKVLRIFALTGMTVLFSASLALAQTSTHDHGSSNAGDTDQAQAPALTPEQHAKFDKIISDYNKVTHILREDIWAKKVELNALAQKPTAKPERIGQLVAELKGLRARQYFERETLHEALKKEGLPLAGMSMGRMGGCGMMHAIKMMDGKQMMHNPAMMSGRMQKHPASNI